MATTVLDNRLRQIAILVASVDSASARHLLLNLPTEIARKVRTMAAEMGPIPPEERRALMTELQKHQGGSTSAQAGQTKATHPSPTESPMATSVAESVWANWSREESIPVDITRIPQEHADLNAPAWTRLSVEALLRFVRHERPTVIAVILQQLPASQAAAVLQRLPRSVSRECLRCLGSLQEIDSEAMQTIDEHLSQRLSEYRHKIETEVENARRINQLLAAAPPELKDQWASWIRPDVFVNDHRTATKAPAQSTQGVAPASTRPMKALPEENTTPSQPTNLLLDQIYRHASITTNDSSSVRQVEWPSTVPFQPQEATSSRARHAQVAADVPSSSLPQVPRSIDLELILTLSPEKLASLLSSLDSQTVLLALAGASPQFMNRFRAMLEPVDAKALDDRIRGIGPLQLRDVDRAQDRVIEAYRSMLGSTGLRLSA